MKKFNLKKMAKGLVNNIGLKVVAILFASLLWLIVVNIEDPVEFAVYRNIPVVVQNEEIVSNQGKIYQIVGDTETVNVTVQAKRSILNKITGANIVASADLSQMQLNRLVPIAVSIQGFEGKYRSATANPQNMQVKIEDIMRNTFPLTVNVTGTPRDGFVVGEITTNPKTITIGGPESVVSYIEKVVARVDVSGMSTTGELMAELDMYDKNGNVVNQSSLTNNLGDQGITVKVQILDTKNIRLNFSTFGEAAEGYTFTRLSSEPQTILVGGTAEKLSKLNELIIPPDLIDITDATHKFEMTVDILPYLPEGIFLVDENANNVVVTVSIEQEGTRTIEFPVDAIHILNLSDRLRLTYDLNTDIEIQFSGTQEALADLDIRNAVYIDLKNHTYPGNFEVPVYVEVPASVKVIRTPIIKITLEKKDE